jgi:hypothetical protein
MATQQALQRPQDHPGRRDGGAAQATHQAGNEGTGAVGHGPGAKAHSHSDRGGAAELPGQASRDGGRPTGDRAADDEPLVVLPGQVWAGSSYALSQKYSGSSWSRPGDSNASSVSSWRCQWGPLCAQVTASLDKRSALRREKVQSFSDQLRSFDVRMSVAGLQVSQQFQDYNQRYTHGAGAWNDLRSRFSDRLGHLSLKKGYEDLLSNLLSGYRLFFEHSEFGFFVSVFEDEDLQIELKVGPGEQNFRAISQLSAGQRCTAIFPVLLKQ